MNVGGTLTLSRKRKRAKSALPAQLEDLDLNNAFFSSTQAMQSDEAMPPAPSRPLRRLRAKRAASVGPRRPSSAARQQHAARRASSDTEPALPDETEAVPDLEPITKRHTRSMAGSLAPVAEPRLPQPLQPRAQRRGSAQRAPVAFQAASTRSSPVKMATRRNGTAAEPSDPASRSEEPSTSAPSTSTASPAAEHEPVAAGELPQWGCASPRKRVCRPASNPALPEHLSGEFAFAAGSDQRVSLGGETARLQRSFAHAAGSPFQGSAAERARARALGGDPDVMFDRLVTRAGMQMPIVRTILFDAHHVPAPGASRLQLM